MGSVECPNCRIRIPGIHWSSHSMAGTQRLRDLLVNLGNQWFNTMNSLSHLECAEHITSITAYLEEVVSFLELAGAEIQVPVTDRACSPVPFLERSTVPSLLDWKQRNILQGQQQQPQIQGTAEFMKSLNAAKRARLQENQLATGSSALSAQQLRNVTPLLASTRMPQVPGDQFGELRPNMQRRVMNSLQQVPSKECLQIALKTQRQVINSMPHLPMASMQRSPTLPPSPLIPNVHRDYPMAPYESNDYFPPRNPGLVNQQRRRNANLHMNMGNRPRANVASMSLMNRKQISKGSPAMRGLGVGNEEEIQSQKDEDHRKLMFLVRGRLVPNTSNDPNARKNLRSNAQLLMLGRTYLLAKKHRKMNDDGKGEYFMKVTADEEELDKLSRTGRRKFLTLRKAYLLARKFLLKKGSNSFDEYMKYYDRNKKPITASETTATETTASNNNALKNLKSLDVGSVAAASSKPSTAASSSSQPEDAEVEETELSENSTPGNEFKVPEMFNTFFKIFKQNSSKTD